MIDSRSYNATECGDGFFGPGVWMEGCRGGFDFTLTFEEGILSILPAAIFLLLSIPRSVYLLRSPDKAKRQAVYTPKLIVSSAYAGIQVGCLALVASSRRLNTHLSIAAAVFDLVAASCIVLVSHIEHVKSIRPSFLLSAYLFSSLLFDAARLRTEWLLSINVAFAAVLSTSTALKLVLLVLENVEKRNILVDSEKELSKESTSGPFSRGFFVWLNSLLISGWATVLTNHDLPAIYEKLSSEKLAVIFGNQWAKATRDGRKASLLLNTVWILKLEICGIVPARMGTVALTIAQPFLISKTLQFLSMPKDEHSDDIGYGLIGGFAFVFAGSAILTAWYEHLSFRVGAMIRGGLVGLIYRKMVKLPMKELNESSAVTLMGNDIETLAERANSLLIETWANGLTVGISVYMLYAQLGPVCIAPVIMAILSVAACTFIGKSLVGRQTAYQKATQARINFTSEVLGSMKAVKMLGYTETFTDLIEKKRDQDLSVGKHYRWMIVWNNAVANANNSLTQAVTFGAYAITAQISGNQPFSASQAITALSVLNVMMTPLAFLLGNLSAAFAAIGCFRRIQEFLLLDERVDTRAVDLDSGRASTSTVTYQEPISAKDVELTGIRTEQKQTSRISISSAAFSWGETKVLNNINASFPQTETGSVTMIIGPIGSGKSSLLKAILGETTSAQGNVAMSTPTIAFCDQTPWVMNASVKANIVAESGEYDEKWFDAVVEACDLSQDFAKLPAGVETVVGDKGVKLSGGQKQRLAIARAVYSRKPVAMFDDVFSGLDKVTEQAVFTRVFGKNGLLRRNGTTIILTTHSVHLLPESDNIIVLGRDGQIEEQGPFSALCTAGKYVQGLDITEPDTDDESDEASSEQRVAEEAKRIASNIQVAEEELAEPPSDRSTFGYYLATIRRSNLAIGGFYIVGQAFCSTFRSVWLTWWGDGRGHSSTDVGYWLSIFTILAALEAFFVAAAIMHFLLIIGPNSGKKLHTKVLKVVMRAPMLFLSNTDTGSLINRFSQDMRLVDIDLPIALAVFLFDVTICFGVTGLAVGAVSYFAAALPFVITVLVMIQRFYVRTSKQLRILEIEHKAPLYSHFLESIQGLATIRAFGWIQPYAAKSLALLDNAQKPSYLLNCIQRWLTLVLDMVVAVLTVLLVVFAVTLKGKLNPSLLGVALVNMMNLGLNLKGIIIAWSQLETSLGAIMRIKTFEEATPSEVLPQEDRNPGTGWPSQGALEFKNLSVQYDKTTDPVLRNISFSMQHGEKIGLIGRSGSGKSSLIQALLRMANINNGQIILDGEDITTVPKSLIRQKLSCLTQDPFLFTNTVRFNADPLSEHTDEEIISAMDRVGVWDIIKIKTSQGNAPLDEKMDESFLSHGQRQLFCLGRALLKKSSVLILDEPTSNIDNQTDAQMQQVIRSDFKDRTIIMIAHRLDTLIDFDKIAVLEKGTLVEFGAPSELLANPDGVFTRLYRSDKTKRRSFDGESN